MNLILFKTSVIKFNSYVWKRFKVSKSCKEDIKLCPMGWCNFCPFFSAKLLQLWKVHWRSLTDCNVQFHHKFSFRFKLGLWLGHSMTFTFFIWNYSSVGLVLYFVSLTCWNVNFWSSFRILGNSSQFSFRIHLYFAPFIFLSILTNFLVSANKKHSHNIMLATSCLTVWMLMIGWYTVLGLYQM